MRKTLTIIGLLVAVLCIACNPDTQAPSSGEGYSVRSDVESISGVSVQSRSFAVEGDPIIGVLLSFDGDDEFHIEYLDGDIRENGDGMKFNYILHIPSEIRAVYAAADGRYPNTGNPFWWYMEHYFQLSHDAILGNYEFALGLLLDCTDQTLPPARVEDVDDSWNDKEGVHYPSMDDFAEYFEATYDNFDVDFANFNSDEQLDGVRVSSQLTSYDACDPDRWEYCWKTFTLGDDGILYYPVALNYAYLKTYGIHVTNGGPLWEYMCSHFPDSGVSTSDEVEEAGFEKLLQFIVEHKDNLPYQNEVRIPDRDPVISEELGDYEEFLNEYYSALVVDAPDMTFSNVDGLPLNAHLFSDDFQDPEKREYCWTTFTIIGEDDRPMLFHPLALIQVYYEYTGKYTDSGTPFWTYMKCYFPNTRLGDIDHVEEVGFAEVLNFIVEHRDEMPFPKVEDYVENLGPWNN